MSTHQALGAGEGPRHGHDRVFDAQLNLLDRQIIDSDQMLVAKVDDVELGTESDGRLLVTGLLTGPGALGPRIGGVVGSLSVAIWSRLAGREADAPKRIDYGLVDEIGTALTLVVPRHVVAVDGFEAWTRDHVIAAIPGSAHRPEKGADAGDDAPASAAADDPEADASTRRRLSELLAMRVRTEDGHRTERVVDVTLAATGDGHHRMLTVDGLLIGTRRPGTLFGYHRHPRQGPWLIRVIVRSLHRHLGYVGWSDVVEVDWDAGELVVRAEGIRSPSTS